MKRPTIAALAAVLLFATMHVTAGDSESYPPQRRAADIVLDTRGAEKVAADNDFAFRFFRETVAAAPADKRANAFVSPLSMTVALGMLYNGCSEGAAAEMAAALGVGDLTPEQINAHYQTLMKALLAADPQTTLAIAGSIWARKGFDIKPAFHDVNREFYNAEAQSRDFSLPATVDEINRWCADNTNGKIPKIIAEIPPEMMMYLINAVYFKGRWREPFDKADTREEKFRPAKGPAKRVPMMNLDATSLRQYEDDAVRCIDLPYGNDPYGNEAFSMMVMLPARGTTLDEFVASLDGKRYAEIVSGLQWRNTTVAMPRWKQECTFDLSDATRNLGISAIFYGGSLTGISDDARLSVSGIVQKSFVEVNEEGAEAAAVTGTVIVGASGYRRVKPNPFRADRPFLYLIRERSTGAILFIGRMDNPTE